jgi:nucleotide-binding universal stress UspA family protein
MGIREILIPLEIGKHIRTKIFWAIELARKFKAKIRIGSVLRINIDIEESYTYRKCKILEKWIKGHDIECDIRILKSKEHKMHETVNFFSMKECPDLTIIMTHQESVINENHIGRFASEIIHNCPTPVLSIVPERDNVFSVMLNLLKIS